LQEASAKRGDTQRETARRIARIVSRQASHHRQPVGDGAHEQAQPTCVSAATSPLARASRVAGTGSAPPPRAVGEWNRLGAVTSARTRYL
jgi:hypothetical protein